MNNIDINRHAWMVRGGPPNANGKYRVALVTNEALAGDFAAMFDRQADDYARTDPNARTPLAAVIRRRVGDDWVRVGL